MADYLFSYGTLQPGLAPAEIEPIVTTFKPLGRAYIHGTLYDFGHYPGAVIGGREKIWGQVFDVPSAAFRRLDEYEGFDPLKIDESQYLRQRCKSILEGGQELEVWVYVYNLDVSWAKVIASGEFAKSRG